MKKRRTQSLHFWSKFDHPFLPEDGQNRKDIISDGEKLQPLGYPNISKSRHNLISTFLEKHCYFMQYLRWIFKFG